MKRTAAGGVALAVVVAAAGGGWFAGRRVASPAEVAARSKPPAPSRITVAVEKTVLASTLITRGLVRYGEPKPVVLSQSSLKTIAPVVTQSPEKGRSIKEGDKALEIGGRPVLVVEGSLPTYRDLRPGDRGPDVDQLKAALKRKGFNPGAGAIYDAATERAVSDWYRSVGYDPFEATEAQKQQLRTARDAAQRARDAVITAERSLQTAQAPDRGLQAKENAASAKDRVITASDTADREVDRAVGEVTAREVALRSAQLAAKSAADALAKAERDAADRSIVDDATVAARDAELNVSDAEQTVVDATRAYEDAKGLIPEAEKGVETAKLDVIDAQKGAEDARKQVDVAKKGRQTTTPAFDQNGNSVPVIQVIVSDDEVRTAESGVRSADSRARAAEAAVRQAESAVTQRQRSITDANKAIEKAQRALTKAQEAVPRTKTAITRAEQAFSDRTAQLDDLRAKAEDASSGETRAEADLKAARAAVVVAKRSASLSTRQAKAGANIAESSLRQTQRGLDEKSAREQLANAQDNVVRASEELSDLEAKTGVSVPANELLFFPSLPLRIDDTKLSRGDPVTGAVMTVTTARLAVDSSLDVADAKLVKVGATVDIEASDFDITLKGKITELATAPGTKGVDPDKVYVEVTPDAGPEANAEQLNGSSVKLTFPVRSTGTEVLAVPVAALSVAADGTSRVEVEDAPSKPTRFVTVTPGLAAEGKVAVTVVVGNRTGGLKEGDLVVVGAASTTDISGSSSEANSTDSKPVETSTPGPATAETTTSG
jgi:peptidoglycan hydrolase-like protein with peptidoglycan-binding domain